MSDLTVIFYTLNKLPPKWQEFQKQTLLEAADGKPIITLSKEPLDWGQNVIQTEPEGVSNIYWQILKGAKLATTPYVGLAEDDALYTKEHFNFLPDPDKFVYNRSRWGMLTWGEPFYFYKPWSGNCVMVAPRKLLIEAMEERFAKFDVLPGTCEPGASANEKRWGLTRRKYGLFFTHEPVLVLNHIYSHSKMEQQKRKRAHPVRAYDIPKWGKAKDIMKKFA